MTPEVNKILDGEDEKFKHLPLVETEAIIGRFCAGHLVAASLSGDNSLRPDFEKLEGLSETWAVCVRKPKLWQVRIFGRFMDRGVFIALGFHERITLGLRENYNAKASDVPAIWDDIFGSYVPHSAITVEEYFGGVCRDVDEQ